MMSRPGASRVRRRAEARGKCMEETCERLSEKTHIWDVANRPWLLPFIADKATGSREKFSA